MGYGLLPFLLTAACGGGGGGTSTQVSPLPEAPPLFVNRDNLSVHPLALTPDGSTLLACDTPDARLEILDAAGGKAWVSCSQTNAVQAFDPLNLAAAPVTVPIEGEEPCALAAPGGEITFTLVPKGTIRRLGIDRDDDRCGDATEADLGTDPADPASHP